MVAVKPFKIYIPTQERKMITIINSITKMRSRVGHRRTRFLSTQETSWAATCQFPSPFAGIATVALCESESLPCRDID